MPETKIYTAFQASAWAMERSRELSEGIVAAPYKLPREEEDLFPANTKRVLG